MAFPSFLQNPFQRCGGEHQKGRAFDFGLVVGKTARWDWPLFMQAGKIVKGAAEDLGIRIVWGGDWTKFRDGPHVELAKDWP